MPSIGAGTTGANFSNTIVVELSVFGARLELFDLELLESAVHPDLSFVPWTLSAMAMELFSSGVGVIAVDTPNDIVAGAAFPPGTIVSFPLLLDDNLPWLTACLLNFSRFFTPAAVVTPCRWNIG